MITKYKARINRRWGNEAKIEAVEVERETDKSVWIKGYRNAKKSEYATYFDSFEAAKSALISAQIRLINQNESQHKSLSEKLREIRSLDSPTA